MNESQPVQPKKILGQYFLKNTTAIMQSINALRMQPGETVIEIGPGAGALTGPLSTQCVRIGCQLIAVEKDEYLAGQIKTPNTTVVIGDILAELPTLAAKLKSYKVIGNIPYYITGALLRVLSELEHKPSMAVLMLQKEVAERICVQAGEMNLLAAATQVWAQPKLLLTLKPSDFEPAPAVYSAVIELKTKDHGLSAEELKKYYAALHRIFKQPRKMLINNLLDPLTRPEAEKNLGALDIPLTNRPQDLSIDQILELSKKI